MENNKNFLQIEYRLLALTEYNNIKLNLIDKLLYSYFNSWTKTTKKIYPSLTTLSIIFGVSVSTIQRSIDVLVKSGMVVVSKENSNKNSKTYYTVVKLDSNDSSYRKDNSSALCNNKNIPF